MSQLQAYSNGLSEIMLGRAIKALNLPREELVIMTKVNDKITLTRAQYASSHLTAMVIQTCLVVGKEFGSNFLLSGESPDEAGLVNQYGLSRKVPWFRDLAEMYFSDMCHRIFLLALRQAWNDFRLITLIFSNARHLHLPPRHTISYLLLPHDRPSV